MGSEKSLRERSEELDCLVDPLPSPSDLITCYACEGEFHLASMFRTVIPARIGPGSKEFICRECAEDLWGVRTQIRG